MPVIALPRIRAWISCEMEQIEKTLVVEELYVACNVRECLCEEQ